MPEWNPICPSGKMFLWGLLSEFYSAGNVSLEDPKGVERAAVTLSTYCQAEAITHWQFKCHQTNNNQASIVM